MHASRETVWTLKIGRRTLIGSSGKSNIRTMGRFVFLSGVSFLQRLLSLYYDVELHPCYPCLRIRISQQPPGLVSLPRPFCNPQKRIRRDRDKPVGCSRFLEDNRY